MTYVEEKVVLGWKGGEMQVQVLVKLRFSLLGGMGAF